MDSGRLYKVNMIFIYETIGKCLLLPLYILGDVERHIKVKFPPKIFKPQLLFTYTKSKVKTEQNVKSVQS